MGSHNRLGQARHPSCYEPFGSFEYAPTEEMLLRTPKEAVWDSGALIKRLRTPFGCVRAALVPQYPLKPPE